MTTQRRLSRVGALRKARAGTWRVWCHAGGKDARPAFFSWDFFRSVWSLLFKVSARKTGRGAEPRVFCQEHIGCTAPRSSGVYGRMT